MDSSDSDGGEAAHYLSRQGETYGPYAAADLLGWLAAGQLVAEDLVWSPVHDAWLPAADWAAAAGLAAPPDTAPEAPPPGRRFPCAVHPEANAIGHCFTCRRLLCADCLRYRSGGFYCAECLKTAKGVVEQDASGFIERVIREVKERPAMGAVAVLAVMLLAAFLLQSTRAVKEEGFDNYDTWMSMQQAERAQVIAQLLARRGETERARHWYELVLRATDRVQADREVGAMARRNCRRLRLRAALQSGRYLELNCCLQEILAEPEKERDEDAYRFYNACLLYLDRNDPQRAAVLFEELKTKRSANRFHLLQQQFAPAAGSSEEGDDEFGGLEEYDRLFGDQVPNPAELEYRLGECYERLNEPDKAKQCWENVGAGRNLWATLAAKKLRP